MTADQPVTWCVSSIWTPVSVEPAACAGVRRIVKPLRTRRWVGMGPEPDAGSPHQRERQRRSYCRRRDALQGDGYWVDRDVRRDGPDTAV